MADLARFLELLAMLRASIAVLRRYASSVPRETLESDLDTQNMVLFGTYRAIQSAIDLGQHAIAERGLTAPATYRDVFIVLGEEGVISRDLAGRMAGWAGLRNVIAHVYGRIDVRVVADALYGELDDLDDFVAAMAGLASE